MARRSDSPWRTHAYRATTFTVDTLLRLRHVWLATGLALSIVVASAAWHPREAERWAGPQGAALVATLLEWTGLAGARGWPLVIVACAITAGWGAAAAVRRVGAVSTMLVFWLMVAGGGWTGDTQIGGTLGLAAADWLLAHVGAMGTAAALLVPIVATWLATRQWHAPLWRLMDRGARWAGPRVLAGGIASGRMTWQALRWTAHGTVFLLRSTARLLASATHATYQRFLPRTETPTTHELNEPAPMLGAATYTLDEPRRPISSEDRWGGLMTGAALGPLGASPETPQAMEDEGYDTPSAHSTASLGHTSDAATPRAVDARHTPPTAPPPRRATRRALPPTTLLTPAAPAKPSTENIDALKTAVGNALVSFKVGATIQEAVRGPVVTQVQIEPAAGVKVATIASLATDLARAMSARSVRIEAPIPGTQFVGVEVPNKAPQVVSFHQVVTSKAFTESKARLPLALGVDLVGQPVITDLASMPHLLVAGTTGSGKSVCTNALIASLLLKYTADEVRLLLVDPKLVEFSGYQGIPHLRHPVVTEPSEAIAMLKWLVGEMNARMQTLKTNGKRQLSEYNEAVLPEHKLPYIVLVIDELADLMMVGGKEVETYLVMLAQKARAAGIHLILATQRPSVDVITGLLKANIPSRIAFRVATSFDSKTILDQVGAENLLGHGDMLFMNAGAGGRTQRVHGAFISSHDLDALVAWVRDHAPAPLDAQQFLDLQPEITGAEPNTGETDERFEEAATLVRQEGHASTSLLQRRMKIGYGRAARLIDQLFDAGIIGPPDGAKARQVLG